MDLKQGAQRQNIVPPESALMMSLLFWEQVFKHPKLVVILLISEGNLLSIRMQA